MVLSHKYNEHFSKSRSTDRRNMSELHNEQLVSKMTSDRRLHDYGASLRASHLKYALQTVFHDLNLNLTGIYTRAPSTNAMERRSHVVMNQLLSQDISPMSSPYFPPDFPAAPSAGISRISTVLSAKAVQSLHQEFYSKTKISNIMAVFLDYNFHRLFTARVFMKCQFLKKHEKEEKVTYVRNVESLSQYYRFQ